MTPHQNHPPAFALPVRFESSEPEDVPLHIPATPMSCGTPASPPRLPMGNWRRVKEPVPRRPGGMNLVLLLEVRAVPQKGGW